MIKEFNYVEFAQKVTDGAVKYLPETISGEEREYFLDNFHKCMISSGKVLTLDKSLNLDEEKITKVIYLIAEWVFKASVALFEAQCPKECLHGVTMDIGFTSFDIAKNLNGIPDITEEAIYSTVEFHVINKIKEVLDGLVEQRVIEPYMKDKFMGNEFITKSTERIELALLG